MSRSFEIRILAECGDVPDEWKKTLLPQMGKTMRVGQTGRIRRGELEFYLHRVSNKVLQLDLTYVPQAKPESVWGPKAWKKFHEDMWNGVEDIDGYLKTFLDSLPCGSCRKHATELLTKLPPTFPLSLWSVDFHNAVNSMLGKPQFSYEDAKKLYSKK